jgi:hypothetical protein
MAVQTLQPAAPASLLRRALLGNAAFSLITGVVCLVEASALAAWTGLQPPLIFIALSALILPFAVGMGWLALRMTDLRATGRIIFALDVAWVAASAVILLTGWLPLIPLGWWIVALVADVVAVFAILEYIGLRRMGKAPGGSQVELVRTSAH